MNSTAPIKLFFAGPVGSGKTTALRCVSGSEIISTDVPLFEGATLEKSTTTVALDYSTIQLDAETTIHLYGIPGQERFDFMRPIIAEGALGAIILIDATSSNPSQDCLHWVSSLLGINEHMALVVGISKADIAPDFSLATVRDSLRVTGISIPTMRVDPREVDQCRQLLRALMAVVMETED